MKPATKTRILKAVFGGDGPRENERRHRANEQLRWIAQATEPWTVDALKAEVRKWLEEEFE